MIIQDASKFSSTVKDWLGEGGHPVPQSQSQSRADVCSGRLSRRKCPFNYQGGWFLPRAVADTVRRWFEAKNSLKLCVEGEEVLGKCEVCRCALSLKIHIPRQVILNHTPDEEYSKFPSHCWLITEGYEKETPDPRKG
jgi:hypothetical protein